MPRTLPEFTDIFYDILDNKIPSTAKDTIYHRWKNKKPRLYLLDDEIDKWCKENNDSVNYAAVLITRNYIFDGIAFREFIRNHACDEYLTAIIQHELIHCMRASEIIIASGGHIDAIASLLGVRAGSLGYSRRREEEAVSQQNLKWGCDDQKAVRWCKSWVADNAPSDLDT